MIATGFDHGRARPRYAPRASARAGRATAARGSTSASAPRSRSPTTSSTSRRSCAERHARSRAGGQRLRRPIIRAWRSRGTLEPVPGRAASRRAPSGWSLYELRVVARHPASTPARCSSRFAHDVVLRRWPRRCCLLGRRRHGRERVAWLLIGRGVLAWTLGEVYYTAVLWDADAIRRSRRPPTPATCSFPPLVLAGMPRAAARARPRRAARGCGSTASPPRSRRRAERRDRVRDRARARRGQRRSPSRPSLAYPLGDLVLLGLIVGALAGTGWRLDRTWMLLAVGVVDLLARRLAVPRRDRRGRL